MEKIIHDVETGLITKVNFTKEEIDLMKKQSAELEAKFAEEIKIIKQKELARNSALAKLIDLGLTEEEIAALQANGRLFQ